MRLAERLFSRYCAENNGNIMRYADYAEPGYRAKENGILVGDWNQEERAYKIAQRLDYSVEWEDEWIECDNCHNLIRCKPNGYGWLPSYISLAEGTETICMACYEEHLGWYLDETLAEVDNTTYRSLPVWFKAAWMLDAGYSRYGDEQETGLHPGQNDNPQDMLRLLMPVYSSVVFQLSDAGQFDVRWIIWVKE